MVYFIVHFTNRLTDFRVNFIFTDEGPHYALHAEKA
jgi:hypothetical protein